MKQSFRCRVYLPSCADYAYFRELSASDYLTTIKLIQNGDDTKIVSHLYQLIETLGDGELSVSDLTRIDIFCILLNLRIICVKSTLDLNLKCKKTSKTFEVPVDLYGVLDNVTNYDMEYTDIVKVNDNCSVTLRTPTELYFTSADDIILGSIIEVKILDESYDVTKYTDEQKNIILDSLPGNVIPGITRHIRDNSDNYSLTALTYNNPHDRHADTGNYKLELYDNSFFEFIKLIFNGSLHDQYYMRYIMSHRLGFDSEYVESRTPAELDTYISFYKKELEEQQKEQEKQSGGQSGHKPGPALPSPNFG